MNTEKLLLDYLEGRSVIKKTKFSKLSVFLIFVIFAIIFFFVKYYNYPFDFVTDKPNDKIL